MDILQEFKQLCQLACKFTEYLNMLMPNNLLIETLQPIVLIEPIDDLKVSFSSTNIKAETNDNIIELSEAVG